jgi:virginiamycin B lyase
LFGRRAIIVLCIVVLIVGGSLTAYEFILVPGGSVCQGIAGGSIVRGTTVQATFGAVTEFRLPGLDRWPNAITTASDGSVWFAEQEVPGVAHLFPNNGTLVEYAWPGYPAPKPPDCLQSVSVSGIAIWDGRVWAADEFSNAIVGVNPADGSAKVLNTTGRADFPYWLAVGPDGALWFTSDNTPAVLGRIETDMTLSVISLAGLGSDEPLQLDFVNSSLAFLTTINQSINSSTHACVCNGHVYSFDPSIVAATIAPEKVGSGFNLVLPTSVSYADGVVWVAQHGASSVVGYDTETGAWATYPTSRVPWTNITLPLLVETNSGKVWFNEHQANKIGLLDPKAGTLTEYSESDPPAANFSGVQNDLSISAAADGLWFTSMTGNYVGFIDPNIGPTFLVGVAGANASTVPPGGNATFTVKVSGTWNGKLTVSSSDSEDYQSIPESIRVVPSMNTIEPGENSSVALRVTVDVGGTLRGGSYTVAVTFSDDLVQQTAYLFVKVT